MMRWMKMTMKCHNPNNRFNNSHQGNNRQSNSHSNKKDHLQARREAMSRVKSLTTSHLILLLRSMIVRKLTLTKRVMKFMLVDPSNNNNNKSKSRINNQLHFRKSRLMKTTMMMRRRRQPQVLITQLNMPISK
jgi:hypothetical protein